MRLIRYRGGEVSFFLPELWEEEEEAGGATFHDEEGVGSLRLSVLTVHTREPIQPGLAARLLQPKAERAGHVPIVALANDGALISYSDQGSDGEDSVLARCWILACPIPPDHARIAIFTFAYSPEEEGSPEVEDILQMLDRELRQCRFATVPGG
jgi:hypothetical protein